MNRRRRLPFYVKRYEIPLHFPAALYRSRAVFAVAQTAHLFAVRRRRFLNNTNAFLLPYRRYSFPPNTMATKNEPSPAMVARMIKMIFALPVSLNKKIKGVSTHATTAVTSKAPLNVRFRLGLVINLKLRLCQQKCGEIEPSCRKRRPDGMKPNPNYRFNQDFNW